MAKPVKCPRCGRENDPSFSYCLDCGHSMRNVPRPSGGKTCSSCGAPLAPQFKFCGQCGKPVSEKPAPAPAAKPNPVPAPIPAPAPAPVPAPEPVLQRRVDARSPVRQPVQAGRAVSKPAAAGPRISLIRHDGQPGPVFPLGAGNLVCGRTSKDAPLPDDPAIAPRHVQFSMQSGRVTVEDLGSTSGTFLRLRAPLLLAFGDEIRIGRQLLRLEPSPRPGSLESSSTTWGSPDRGYTLRMSQLLEGGGVGEVFPLKNGENLVGRESGDITFPFDRYVSGRHARVEVKEGRATISDLGSSNGTFFRISKPTALQNGDQLLVGLQLIRFDT